MKEIASPFQQLLDQYQAAVLAKDVAAFTALYDDEVEVFDMWGSWSLSGIDAWRAMATGWFASLGTETVVVTASEVHAAQSGELAIGHALLTFTAIAASGERLRSMSNRITVGMKRSGHGWKVFHEHTSAPIDPQSIKAILERER
jgi:ketosteroid isomerase-like protein